MTKHKTFEQLYTVLLDFIKNKKRIPSSSSTDKEETRLGNWCYQLRKKSDLLNQLNMGRSLLSKKTKNWIKNNKINVDSCVTIQNNKIVVSL